MRPKKHGRPNNFQIKELCRSGDALKKEDAMHKTDPMDNHYGRRVEADRSWSVYHVFTGVPAHACGHSMIGLNRSDATQRMLFLNRRNERLRIERNEACRPDVLRTDMVLS
jgi:hypothetical protein